MRVALEQDPIDSSILIYRSLYMSKPTITSDRKVTETILKQQTTYFQSNSG